MLVLMLVQDGASRDSGESIHGAVHSSGPTSSSESIRRVGGGGECERERERESARERNLV